MYYVRRQDQRCGLQFTLHTSFHQRVSVGQREDVTHVEDFAHVHMEELQAGGEGHPEELHLFALLLRQALVSEVRREVMADGHGQLLGLFAHLSQLVPQPQAVRAAADTRGQVVVTCHHLCEGYASDENSA